MVAKHTILAAAASRPTFDYVNGVAAAGSMAAIVFTRTKVSDRSLARGAGLKDARAVFVWCGKRSVLWIGTRV